MYAVNFKRTISADVIELPKLANDGSNKDDFFVPDVLGSHDFALNYGGYPRSDISIINDQNNMANAKAMLESLSEYNSPSVVDSSISDNEILLSLRSRYQQTASEQISYFERELLRRDNLRALTSLNADKSTPIGFDKQDVPSTEVNQ